VENKGNVKDIREENLRKDTKVDEKKDYRR